MTKKATLFLTGLMILTLLTGCMAGAVTTAVAISSATTTAAATDAAAASNTAPAAPSQAAATTAATAASAPGTVSSAPATGFPVTVTDHLGRAVTIKTKPNRLVSGYYITTSLLIALGLQDQVVGLEAKAANRPIYKLSAPRLLDLPNVGTAKDFNLEGAIALKPDLVILPVKLKDAIQTLSDMGIAVLGVNPESRNELNQVIEMVGQATGTAARAASLLAKTKALDEKAAALGKGEAKQKVYLAGPSALLSTAGSRMYQSSLIENAGAINVAAAVTDSAWATIAYEQLLQWQSDLIVVVPEAVYTVDSVLAEPAISGLKAVQGKKVHQMPKQFEAWDSPVPSGVLGQLYLASTLYPGKYSAAAFALDVKAFYWEFYGFEAVLAG